MTVNVRRGDYYSDPVFRGRYSFDIEAYLDVALARAVEMAGPVDHVLVVSDGIEWCRARLGGLLSRSGAESSTRRSPLPRPATFAR